MDTDHPSSARGATRATGAASLILISAGLLAHILTAYDNPLIAIALLACLAVVDTICLACMINSRKTTVNRRQAHPDSRISTAGGRLPTSASR